MGINLIVRVYWVGGKPSRVSNFNDAPRLLLKIIYCSLNYLLVLILLIFLANACVFNLPMGAHTCDLLHVGQHEISAL